MKKHVNKKSEKGELKTKGIPKVQFLLMRVKIHGDILTVRSICAAHLPHSLPDPLFLHLLIALGPSRLP